MSYDWKKFDHSGLITEVKIVDEDSGDTYSRLAKKVEKQCSGNTLRVYFSLGVCRKLGWF